MWQKSWTLTAGYTAAELFLDSLVQTPQTISSSKHLEAPASQKRFTTVDHQSINQSPSIRGLKCSKSAKINITVSESHGRIKCTEILHLSNDQVTNTIAVSLHSKHFASVASRDVEIDEGAAAVRVISIWRFDGQHCVSHRSVLCQSVAAILYTQTVNQ